jgi:cytochrome c oxidase subunit 4
MSSSQHVISVRTNLTIYAILMALLVLTIAVAYVNLGALGVPVALTIATIKAVLILLYFMHVKFSPKLVWVFSGAAFFWLLILLALSFNDFFARGWIEVLGK